ncbi:MAG TPA: IS481 family transposase [Solirubrobacterales bacterium]|jgi:transposase InsO family protein|nr:IS481 family transposase [Solirubrobacterales bacterium]
MRIHRNARTCPNSRRLLVRRIEEEGWGLIPAAEAAGISVRSARKWLARWRAEGEAGLLDRSSAPRRRPTRLPADRLEAIEALRRLRMTAAEIAEVLGMALSTVSRWLKRIGLGRRSALAPPEPPNRYERKRPGELIHVDVKKLGRIRGVGHRISGSRASQSRTRREGRRTGAAGWEFVHVCVDDATRLAYVEVLPDERGATAAGFLRRAVAWLSSMGVTVERVLSDNGSCYRSRVHATACRELSMRHLRTRPYRPRTNGKAERFIQTMTNDWAYGAIYGSSAERTAALPGWLDHYNYRRPHGSLGHRAPAARLAELEQPRE